jgi:hypothetical protein
MATKTLQRIAPGALQQAVDKATAAYGAWTMGGKRGAALEATAIRLADEADQLRSLHRAQQEGKRFILVLASGRNLDFPAGEQGRQLSPRYLPVATYAEAQRQAADFRDSNELGGGNWYNSDAGWIYDARTGTPVARVAYNGNITKGAGSGRSRRLGG